MLWTMQSAMGTSQRPEIWGLRIPKASASGVPSGFNLRRQPKGGAEISIFTRAREPGITRWRAGCVLGLYGNATNASCSYTRPKSRALLVIVRMKPAPAKWFGQRAPGGCGAWGMFLGVKLYFTQDMRVQQASGYTEGAGQWQLVVTAGFVSMCAPVSRTI